MRKSWQIQGILFEQFPQYQHLCIWIEIYSPYWDILIETYEGTQHTNLCTYLPYGGIIIKLNSAYQNPCILIRMCSPRGGIKWPIYVTGVFLINILTIVEVINKIYQPLLIHVFSTLDILDISKDSKWHILSCLLRSSIKDMPTKSGASITTIYMYSPYQQPANC